ncbi:alpha/beta fold hydrolase [Nevskia ramosa]|uniref:alpha/beta fold hydrolase n=1 Tax=Nevskia ramosa TaxID=64002 RepID=UPI001FDFB3C2|nr:alpha/beta hydrolase [Nevskia ramosa]
MPDVKLNDVTIAYQQMGEGPELVFVHGLAASRAFWFLQYALPLSKHFRITLFDLRGHGYSSMPASGYEAVLVAEDLAGLLDHLGIAACTLIGHSYGGGVALEFAGRYPQRVDKLVVLDTKINALQPTQRLSDSPHLSPFEIEVSRTSGHDWEQEPQVGLLFLEVLARWKTSGGGSEAKDVFTPFGEGRGAQRTAKQFVELLDQTTAMQEVVLPGIDGPAIAALPMPCLWIYGDWSRSMPSCRALQALRPAAEFRIVPEGGHFFPISNAARVMDWLRPFFQIEAESPPRVGG